jgi:hypothetical protein
LLEVVREIIAWCKQNPPSTDAPKQIETYATEMSDEVDPEFETNSVVGDGANSSKLPLLERLRRDAERVRNGSGSAGGAGV